MGNIVTVVIILILILLCGIGVKNMRSRVSNGCCGAGGDEEKTVRVRDKDPSHYPHCAVLGVEGMTCSNCKKRVENALNSEEGVWAEVDLKKNTATVRMKEALPEGLLRKIISRAGYSVSSYTEQ